MEKLMYLLWKDRSQSREAFKASLRNDVVAKLDPEAFYKIQLNVVDDAVLPAEHMLICNSAPRAFAVLSVWMDSSVYRQGLERVLDETVNRFAGYLVTESSPLRNIEHPPTPGERTWGFSHIVLLQRPQRLSLGDWISIWHGAHTQVAIDTQSTFYYTQNVVARPLSYAAPVYHAIIEEGFPPAAMVSQHAFYDAEGDDAKYKANQTAMLESCQRFIDFDKIDACSTSQYIIKDQLPSA